MEFSSTFRKPPGFLSNENQKLPIVVLGNPHCFLVSKYTTRKPPGNPQETNSSFRKTPGNPHHFLVSKCTTRKPPGFISTDNRKSPIVVLGIPQETPIIF